MDQQLKEQIEQKLQDVEDNLNKEFAKFEKTQKGLSETDNKLKSQIDDLKKLVNGMATKVNQLNDDAAEVNDTLRKLQSTSQPSITIDGDEATSNALASLHIKIDDLADQLKKTRENKISIDKFDLVIYEINERLDKIQVNV